MVQKIEAEPNFMVSFHPTCIRVECERLVIAKQRIPALRVAIRGIVAKVESRHSAFALVGAIRTGKPERLAAEVSAEIRRLYVLSEACPAERSIHDERRGDGVGVANGGELYKSVPRTHAAVAQASSAG